MDYILSLFSAIDWAAIGKIVAIDIMLGVDNAIVIALACAGLPVAVRGRAIVLGTAGAVLLRAGLLAVAGLLFGLPVIKFVAGAYLLYIGIKLLCDNAGDEGHNLKPTTTIWGAVSVILVADFMMSLDNVLAVVGASQSAGEHSTLYAIAGIILSIPIIIFGAQGIMKLMDRFPIIMWVGAGLLGWVGMEMILTEPLLISYVPAVATMNATVHLLLKVLGFVAVVAIAKVILSRRNAAAPVTVKV